MNFNFSKDKIIIGIAIIALAGFGYYKSSSDSLNSNQIQSIVDTKQTDNINNQSEVENKENEDNSSKMCQIDGCVNKPGVYSFKKDDRIKDIIDLAGGFTKDADTKSVNLAMKLKDEMKIFIPSKNEISKLQNHNTENSQIVTLKDNNSTNLVNINTADSNKLQTLPGIGPSKAKKIIEFREKNQFKKIEELKNVDGIGEKTFESLKSLITID
ncbi:helix-hairpin-helix domain-containing protein [Finegoldia magna]|uniref:helix-hairpin-helix domain-containing protein n=1 Tax=Finegoldia magna TaxID=1260 RepID=UPI000763F2C4|nr:helix-hairpin-helix domain-containing protein [Finegoldia magna]KXA08911.1 comEA protein [Finegoldia magna]MDU1212916.1 helix-hairpin-helix domain-containing protein [Finegoldia magna]MDU5441708.1 helix-hairpin-helix domain-containing protein [Finegoldia magna]MDU5922024.1 helix-hairpin-helix domain-containing protein [Finegoldia magna]MDU5969726.1 helix-hairpin-helix domain-containing protein [Finegoldia magna]